MKKNFVLTLLLLLGTASFMNAQVKDISYTLSPALEYNFFNSKSGLNSGFLYGGQLGFGFGEFVELRANYMRSYKLKTDFSEYGFGRTIIQGLDTLTVTDAKISKAVQLQRYGGELKINVARSAVLPYILAGGGIQKFTGEQIIENSQIYTTLGVGLTASIKDRFTINVAGLSHAYRHNPLNYLLTFGERNSFGIDGSDYVTESLRNWGVRASLLFYLGGRAPGQMTETDEAYLDSFTSGFSGLSVPIEPQFGAMAWNDALPYTDSYFGGLGAGFNFGPYVGLRGFYYSTLVTGDLTRRTGLDLWGGEGIFRLSSGGGLAPYLSLGAGKIRINEDYPQSDAGSLENQPFLTGGLGIAVPFAKFLNLSLFGKSILTNTQEVDDIVDTNGFQNSWAYGAQVNFIFGKDRNKNLGPTKLPNPVELPGTYESVERESEDYDIDNEERKGRGRRGDRDRDMDNKQIEVIVEAADLPSAKSQAENIQMSSQDFQFMLNTIVNALEASGGRAASAPSYNSNDATLGSGGQIKVDGSYAPLFEALSDRMNELEEKVLSSEARQEELRLIIEETIQNQGMLQDSMNDLQYQLQDGINNIINQINTDEQ